MELISSYTRDGINYFHKDSYKSLFYISFTLKLFQIMQLIILGLLNNVDPS